MSTDSMPAQMYPHLNIGRNTHPNRFYAFPILGFVIKIIMLIPQFFELAFLSFAVLFIVWLINPFVVLFTGKYWNPAYELIAGITKLSVKVFFFLYGLTDKYPGFDFTIPEDYKVEITKPEHPSRFFAIPILGGLARIILLIPYIIYENVIRNAGYVAIIAASFPVLVKGYYPESLYEMARDAIRVNVAATLYVFGITDKYPSFWISMNHRGIKIILIILGVLFSLFNITYSPTTDQKEYQMEEYNNTQPSDLDTGY